jgi:predicted nucleic acid-binding protein
MSLLDDIPEGSLVGLDTAIWIYEFEAHPTYGPIVNTFFRDRLDSGKNRSGSSLLTLGELLVRPIALGRTDLADRYRAAFVPRPGFEVWAMTREVVERSAELRARHRLKLADALHLAAALVNRADLFLSNDDQLRRVTEIRVLLPDDYAAAGTP